MNKLAVKSKKQSSILKQILTEVRTLRKEVSLFIPTENISDYRNTSTIKKAYKNASSKYSPLWK